MKHRLIAMKSLIFAFHVLFTVGGLCAETPSWQPSPGHMQVPIWPASVPDAQPAAGPEDMKSVKDYIALKNAGVPVEMHLSAQGGHAFGLRPSELFPITRWPQLVETWLRTIGMLPE